MQRSIKFLTATMLATSLLAPLSASALGTSFGGRVVAATPCISPLGPSIWFKVIPASLNPILFFILTPKTATYLAGPVNHIGQQVLGVADIPFKCMVGTTPFFGQRVQIEGTSAI